MSKTGRIAVQSIVGVVVLAIALRQVATHWDEVREANVVWRLSVPWLLAAVAITWSAYGLLILSWQRLLAGWGTTIRFIRAARVWALSSLGRYIPGKIWTIIGMSLLAKEEGVPPAAAAGSAVLLQLVAIGTGVAVVGLTAQSDLRGLSEPVRVLLAVLGIGSLGASLAVLHPRFFAWLVRRLARQGESRALPPGPVLFGIAANAIAWLAYGIAFWCLVRGTLPEVQLSVVGSIGVFCGSYIVGLVAPFAPGGLGVRESMFIVMLQSRAGLGNAVALAVGSRLFLTVVELGFVVPFLFLKPEPRRAAP